jgi:hypothetical protein
LQAIFVLLRLQEEVHDFNVDDPVPRGDPRFDPSNKGIHVLFNAARDDPQFEAKKYFDVVTDGNFQCNRALVDDETKYATKNLPGRPKTQKIKTKSRSRCKAVNKVETIKLARTQTGGLFVTVNMKNRSTCANGRRNTAPGKNEILHMAEMLNGENTAYKKECLKDMKKVR